MSIINTSSSLEPGKELDKLIIPNEIYNETINYDTEYIIKYFLDNPKLMFNFISFSRSLNNSYNLLCNRKCGCNYTIPWITKYAETNNISNKIILLYGQQIVEHRYMILYWYPRNKDNKQGKSQSYMRYLCSIASQIITDLKKFNYNLENSLTFNLNCKNIYFNIYYNYFKNCENLNIYIKKYLICMFYYNNVNNKRCISK